MTSLTRSQLVTSTIPVSTTVCPVAEALSRSAATAQTPPPSYGTAPATSVVLPVPSSYSASAPMGTGSAISSAVPTANVTSTAMGTGVPASSQVSAGNVTTSLVETTDVSTHTTDNTLTYTLGAGSSTTVVTTTIHVTSTQTRTSVGAIPRRS